MSNLSLFKIKDVYWGNNFTVKAYNLPYKYNPLLKKVHIFIYFCMINFKIMSLNLRKRFGKTLTTEQDLLISMIETLSNLALEVTAEQIDLNTDTLETSNDAIQAATESIDSKTFVRSNLHKLKNEANDLAKTFAYYGGVDPINNPSGNKNIVTINYQGTIDIAGTPTLTSITETFTWDADDDVLTITVS